MAELKGSDTTSEVSESGTSVCTFSSRREELQELARSIGLDGADLLHQDRFRVNGRKMENLLVGAGEVDMSAEMFFQKVVLPACYADPAQGPPPAILFSRSTAGAARKPRDDWVTATQHSPHRRRQTPEIMSETNTHIMWPSRLKIGSKSHKDPHIRVAGRVEDVKLAKSKIMAVLDTRSNRVIMKLDVSYTDHSHIIGKAGLVIKQVMEETGCHIHFPDSNRNNPNEKSNQVSIAGEICRVERARSRIRELSSLTFTFQLPIMGTISAPDLASPLIIMLQEKYNVQVKFQTQSKLYSTLVVVKGCEQEVKSVEEATLLLVQHMCGTLSSQVQIQMFMEISPQHHPTVRGTDDVNLLRIMSLTQTQIMFPDVQNPCVPSLKKSNVTVTGSIHNVYLARQMLMGSLPLVLMFEMEEMFPDSEDINSIMNSLQVLIIVRPKPCHSVISIIIKGIERHASNIYEAYRQLKGLKGLRLVAEIPTTYNIPNIPVFNPVKKQGSAKEAPIGCQPAVNPMTRTPPEPNWPHLYNQISQFFSHQQQLQRNLHENGLGHVSSLSLPDIFRAARSPHTSKCSSPMPSPNSSCVQSSSSGGQQQAMQHANSDLCWSNEWRAPGFGRRSNIEYQEMKRQAITALQTHPLPNDLRVPTSTWAGYGFSSSDPAAVMNEAVAQSVSEDEGAWGPAPGYENRLGFSNLLDSVFSPHMEANSSSESNSLPTLLASINLEKYIPLFRQHEIDLVAFRSLTEQDLKEIGISALGARRRLLTSIAELNRSQSSLFQRNWENTDRKSSSSTNSLV